MDNRTSSAGKAKRRLTVGLAAAGFLLLLVPSAHLAWTSRDMAQLGNFHDDGMYWVTAKSLADGTGYRILSLPGAPAATKYPPLFPLYLSIAWRLSPSFPQNLSWLAFLAWLPYPVLIALNWKFLKDLRFGYFVRVLGCALLALSPTTVALSILALSHLLFCVLLLTALMLVEKSLRKEAPWQVVTLAGIAAAAAYLTRTTALPLLISAPALFLLKRRYRDAGIFLACMGCAVLAWMIWAAENRTSSPDLTMAYYTDYLGFYFRTMTGSDLLHVLTANVDRFFAAVGSVFIAGVDGRFLGVPPGLVLTAICILGIVKLVRRGEARHYALFTILYTGMILVWNFAPTDSLILPIFPLLLAGFFTAAADAGRLMVRLWRSGEAPERILAGVGLGVAGTFAVFLVFQNSGALNRELPAFVENQRVMARTDREAFRWIADNTPGDAVFLSRNDAVLYLFTGRRALWMFTNPLDLYRGDFAAMANQFRHLDDLSRRWKLTHAFLTDADFPQFLRKQVLEILDHDSSLETLKIFPESSVRRFASGLKQLPE